MEYAIIGGDEEGKFAIDPSSGEITVAGDLSSASGTSIDLTVEAIDDSGGAATVTTTITVTLTCFSGTAVPNPSNNPGLVSDCKILLGLKSALAGSVTLNWSGDAAMTGWGGVTIRGIPQRVTRLSLERRGLTGVIPPEVGDLAGLRELSLGHNELTGSIPATLGKLRLLEGLRLNSNELTGRFRRSWGH